MKLQAILLFCCIGLVVCAKFELRTRDDALAAHEDCRSQFNIPDEVYEKYLNYEFVDHRRTSCYIKCFVEKMGLFTENRGFSEANIIAQFTHTHSKNIGSVQHGLEKCIDHNEWESDKCTWTNRVFQCWLKINRHIVRQTYGAKA